MSCACGCGREPKPGNRFINGHNGREGRGKKPNGKYERNAEILRVGLSHGRGALSEYARTHAMTRQRVFQIWKRERERLAA